MPSIRGNVTGEHENEQIILTMRIVYITAGAAGMYCGSCMRDNTLVAALRQEGHDALLVPTYTPISTDEADVSLPEIFFGGINVYLEQKCWIFRHTPWWIDRLLNFRWLLKAVSRFASNTDYSQLGDLTISMLKGLEGNQRKEVERLGSWLATVAQPEVVVLTNALISGLIPHLRDRLKIPVFVTLQGDDIFLEALPPTDREQCLKWIRQNCLGCQFICTSRYYADFMSDYLGLPREDMYVIYPGINLSGHSLNYSVAKEATTTIGYFARICPEKGLHNLIEAFVLLRKHNPNRRLRLKASGWLGEKNKTYLRQQIARLEAIGLAEDFSYVPCPTLADKVQFLQSLDILSVPTVYREPKGLYVLEAWANGVPVVLPRHGAFTELIEDSGAGLLVEPGNIEALAEGIERMLDDTSLREHCSRAGVIAVKERYSAEVMARNTAKILARSVLAHRPLVGPAA